jgi:hypothetical protein
MLGSGAALASTDSSTRRVRCVDKGHAHIPPDRELTRGATFARAHPVESTVRNLGVEVDDALDIAEKIEI